jgi:alpha-L-rhamnosidase
MWRDDMQFVADRMLGVRAVLDLFRTWVNEDDLVQAPKGWNFIDWVSGWGWGLPPDAEFGVSGIINWLMVLMLEHAAELEIMLGEQEMADRNRSLAKRIAKAADKAFWSEEKGIYADDLAKTSWSEHSQCLVLLGGHAPRSKRTRIIHGLLNDPDLKRTTIYFNHYLFETYKLIGRMDRFFDRMSLWFEMKGLGFKTTLEEPEPSRSDCHAWGAHPLYHYLASVLGIRPAAPGFAKVRIEPQLGPLMSAKGVLPHPRGFITVDLAAEGDRLFGTIELPDGISGELIYGGKTAKLKPGKQTLSGLSASRE